MSTSPKTLPDRLRHASGSIDGVAAVVQGLVACGDAEASRQAFACADLLERISNDLDAITAEVQDVIAGTAKVGAV